MSEDDLTIDGFQLTTCVGSGGTSQVWEVVEQGTNRHLAMKIVYSKVPDYKECKAILKHEAAVFKTLDHPNIVKFDRYQSSRDWTYLLMEYFRAPNIKQQIKVDIIPVHARVKPLMEQVCLALAHIHQKGWIHRDLKPDNILMNRAAEVRLVDFSLTVRQMSGLGKLIGSKQFSTIQGTRTYIAPETIRRKAPTPATDLYSLGITFFEILVGKTPFQGSTPQDVLQKHLTAQAPAPSEFNPNVTAEMDRVVLKLLSKKPDARYKDVGELLGELRRIRIFKEDVEEKRVVVEDKPEDLMEQMKSGGVNSRLDAQRERLVRENPEFAVELQEQKAAREKRRAADRAKILKAKEPAPAAPAPQQQFPPQQYPQQPMPMMPQMYPGMPPQGYPQQYPPQQYPPQGFPQPGYPGAPGMPQPGMMPPGYPPGPQFAPPPGQAPQVPQPPAAARPAAPQQPPRPAPQPQPARPAAPAPQRQAAPPAPPPRPAAPPKPAQPAAARETRKQPLPEDEDLPFMTELPDVL